MGKHGGYSKKHMKHGRHGYGSYGLGGGERRTGDHGLRHHHKGKGGKKHKSMKKGFKGKDISDHQLKKNGLTTDVNGVYGFGNDGGDVAMGALVGSQNMTMGIMAAQH